MKSRVTARIFLAEDHPQVRQQLIDFIERSEGFSVCGEAEDAESALARIVSSLPDLVLLDLSLTNSSGFQVLENLRKLQINLPVLVLSIHDASLFAERSLQAGARGYLTKQAAVYQLMPAIKALLAGQVYLEEKRHNQHQSGPVKRVV